MIDYSFIIPDTKAFQSGGNLYNARLIEALNKKGVLTQEIEIDKLNQLRKSSIYFVDSLYLSQVEQLSFLENKYLIVHHLDSLYPPEDEDSSFVFEDKERPLLNQFKGFLVTSNFTKQYLVSKGIIKPIYCIEPALDYKFSLTKRTFEKLNAIIVANLIERKGILPFLQKLERHPMNNFQLIIYGSSHLEPSYAKQCLNLIDQLSGVTYGGELPQDKLFKAYEQANLFISIAYMETYGMAIQEAKNAGLPLLLLDGGNAKFHLTDDSVGWCFETMGALFEQFKSIAQHPALLKMESSNQANYSWEDAAQQLIYFFKDQ